MSNSVLNSLNEYDLKTAFHVRNAYGVYATKNACKDDESSLFKNFERGYCKAAKKITSKNVMRDFHKHYVESYISALFLTKLNQNSSATSRAAKAISKALRESHEIDVNAEDSGLYFYSEQYFHSKALGIFKSYGINMNDVFKLTERNGILSFDKYFSAKDLNQAVKAIIN